MDNKKTVSDHVLERLKAWGVRRIFGYSGDGINGLLGSLDKSNHFEFIQPVHEEIASLMATAHAKFTGETGVCMATQGPGALHLLNGLYDAKLDHQPVVAILGQQATYALGASYQQEIDLQVLLKDVANGYLATIWHPAQVEHVINRAFQVARDQKTVSVIVIPHDIQGLAAQETLPHKHGYQHSSPAFSSARLIPQEDTLERAAKVLNAAKRIAILIGAGAIDAEHEVLEVSKRLGAGIAKSLLGKALVDDHLPFVTGTIGWLGTDASHWMMKHCDALLMIGSSFPYTEHLPEPGQARGVQIDHDASRLSLRYPMEVALKGNSKETLQALLPRLKHKEERHWQQEIETQVSAWWEEVARRGELKSQYVNPQKLFNELSIVLPDKAIVTGDSGTGAVWLARHLRLNEGMMSSLSGGLGTMGSSIPYALAAKLAFPERPVIAICGDGAMQMNGLNTLINVARHQRDWTESTFIIVVLNNRDLNYVTWEQRLNEGNPRFAASQDVRDLPYADIAKAMGLNGKRIETSAEVAQVWQQALDSKLPFVIDAVVDPTMPPLPPELPADLQNNLEKALRNDPEAARVRAHLEALGL